MDRVTFVGLLTPLVLAMRADFDQPTWTAYFRALHDVPAPLLEAVVEAMLREPLEFFPKAGELRARAERQRRLVLAANPHDGCCECEDQRGWRATIVDGVPWVEKCPCLERHKAKLERLGVLAPVAQLKGEATGENEPVYPSMDQLPAPVRSQLTSIAGRKALK